MSRAGQNALKKWRESQAKNVLALATEIGVTRQTWYSWERGASVPPERLMAALVDLTKGAVQPNDFYPDAMRRLKQAA